MSQYHGIERTIAALTVYVETPDGTGSGFFYNLNPENPDEPDWTIITNRHVVHSHRNVKLCHAVFPKCVPGTVIAKGSDTFDVAVVDYDGFSGTPAEQQFMETALSSWRGGGGNWRKADAVYASGYPGGNKAV